MPVTKFLRVGRNGSGGNAWDRQAIPANHGYRISGRNIYFSLLMSCEISIPDFLMLIGILGLREQYFLVGSDLGIHSYRVLLRRMLRQTVQLHYILLGLLSQAHHLE